MNLDLEKITATPDEVTIDGEFSPADEKGDHVKGGDHVECGVSTSTANEDEGRNHLGENEVHEVNIEEDIEGDLKEKFATPAGKKCCGRQLTLGCVCWTAGFPLAIFLIVIVVLYIAFDGLPFLPQGSLPFLERWTVDPFEGVHPRDVGRWEVEPDEDKLTLRVLGALDAEWLDSFDLAVRQWDDGNPDALDLFTEMIGTDVPCTLVGGSLKVCNGEYGKDTGWYGINAVLTRKGFIRASAARLNDSLLRGAKGDRRQYTICHEMGHGFGLSHTDENFLNRNLGNCMDYTNNPKGNTAPDTSNFEALFQMYGPPSRANSTTATDSDTQAARKSSGSRQRRVQKEVDVPDEVLTKVTVALKQVELDARKQEFPPDRPIPSLPSHERSLKQISNAYDLGQGYELKVHMLLS